MEKKFKYNTVASAIRTLRKEGFTFDFNIFEDHVAFGMRDQRQMPQK
jgi:hypothetical protein